MMRLVKSFIQMIISILCVWCKTKTCENHNNNCIDCVSSQCSWTAETCRKGCDVADASCYNYEYFPSMTAAEICEIEETNREDARLCNSKTNCSECVETVKSDGESNCQWFFFEFETEYCGSECDMNGCGASSCSDSDSSNSNSSNSSIYNSSNSNNSNSNNSNSSGNNESQPVILDCWDSRISNCNDCLGIGNNCAWAVGSCMDSCSQIGDASCYSFENFVNMTAEEVCRKEQMDRENDELCSSKNSCTDCVQTAIMSDDKNTETNFCYWLQESGGCMSIPCNMIGCGSSVCGPPIPSN